MPFPFCGFWRKEWLSPKRKRQLTYIGLLRWAAVPYPSALGLVLRMQFAVLERHETSRMAMTCASLLYILPFRWERKSKAP